MLKEMQELHRYPAGAIIPVDTSYRVSESAIHDFMMNRKALKHGIPVAAYDPKTAGELIKNL